MKAFAYLQDEYINIHTRKMKPRHIVVIILKTPKTKGNFERTQRCRGLGSIEGDTSLKGATIRLTGEFSTEIMKARKQ